MPIARYRHHFVSCVAPFLLPFLAACDTQWLTGEEAPVGEEPPAASVTGQSGADTNEGAIPGTFTPRVGASPSQEMADRLPASPDETIMIPATGLFPGEAAVIPEIVNPYSGDAEAIAAGERHFAAFNCAGCHAPLGGGGMGPPLSDDKWIYGSGSAQVFMSIMHGRPNGMPAWASMLPERAVWELVAYIETLDEIENYAQRLGFEDNPGFDDEAENEPTDDSP